MQKSTIHQTLNSLLLQKYKELNAILSDASAGKSTDAKSSAGDKHEVGVAMAQLEREKLGKQVQILQDQLGILRQIDSGKKHLRVSLGSLVNCEDQWYYFAIGFGAIQIEEVNIFCLNPHAPLGKEMIGKSVGDEVNFQNKKMQIQDIF